MDITSPHFLAAKKREPHRTRALSIVCDVKDIQSELYWTKMKAFLYVYRKANLPAVLSDGTTCESEQHNLREKGGTIREKDREKESDSTGYKSSRIHLVSVFFG